MMPLPAGLVFLEPSCRISLQNPAHSDHSPISHSKFHRKVKEARREVVPPSHKAGRDSDFVNFVFTTGLQRKLVKGSHWGKLKQHRGCKRKVRAVCRHGSDLRIPRLIQGTPGLLRGLCAAALSAKVGPFALSSGAVHMSCLPLSLPMFSHGEVKPPSTARAVELHKKLVLVCTAQGSLALVQTLFGDILGGSIGIVVCSVGLCSTMPRGMRLLPTYITSTFLNGSLSLLAVAERIPFMPWPLFSWSQPVVANAVHLVLLAQPALSFFGALVSYQYLKEVRAVSQERAMAGDTDFSLWPQSGGTGLQEDNEARDGSSTFTPFAGTPHRLKENHDKEVKVM